MNPGSRTTDKNRELMINILRDRKAGYKNREIAAKYWIKENYAQILYGRAVLLDKYNKLEKEA